MQKQKWSKVKWAYPKFSLFFVEFQQVWKEQNLRIREFWGICLDWGELRIVWSWSGPKGSKRWMEEETQTELWNVLTHPCMGCVKHTCVYVKKADLSWKGRNKLNDIKPVSFLKFWINQELIITIEIQIFNLSVSLWRDESCGVSAFI